MGAIPTILKRSVTSFGLDRCSTLSAAIAYRTVFALFPLALVGVSLLGFFMGDESARQRVIEGISEVIPLGTDGEDALQRTLQGANSAKGWIGLIGLAMAAWSASGLFGELRQALNVVWDADRTRPMLRAKSQDLIIMFGFGGLLAASTVSTGVLRGAHEAGAQWIGPLLELADPVFNIIVFFAPLVLTFAAFMVLYRIAPHARLGWRDVWPAALIAALFFEFGKNLLTYYIANLSNFNALAGSLGAAILFLVFVYYASQVILFAAEFAKHLLLVRTGTLPATDPKTAKQSGTLVDKASAMVVGLWKSPETHHDAELPYQPARIDPATNRPTNTVEEVTVRWADDLPDAGKSTDGKYAPDRQHEEAGSAPSMTVIAGEARRLGTKLFIESEGKVTQIEATPAGRVTRNGNDATVQDIRAGDWLTMAVARDGTLLTVDATNAVMPAAAQRKKEQLTNTSLKVFGFAAAMLAGVIGRARGSGAQEKRDKQRPSRENTILHRKPSE
ncbi:MAG: YihY/virulence factor BrkB family protein [Dehalococcoidia bacterium]